ncbi:DUF2478 domain-containing protein [Chelatococcus asaccharovorans]|uniref:Uncharacterized protein DUF2478 n=1 Tax=Chelatococcus asaccharovorans TaxID=28210 RepID=A0A2V3U567_9HYPH|nr:DUF2478 domain-containing protein [Chelatococcus asaccharovorans]MBS7702743.1 DUF2478 domain-containing protein [Chelatococcus asaccharovorans]PXW57036.1 uncharacterized protein DUF2478 [Chelatococcus asaccharovorans]
MNEATRDGFRVAAIVYDARGAADEILAALASRLRERGVAIAGLIQHNRGGGPAQEPSLEPTQMVAEDLASGRLIGISQSRGAAAAGCRLDSQGLAEAAALAAQSLPKASFAILSKFGKAEVDGGGLRAEFITALSHGIPLVTSVPASRLADWEAFLGSPWHNAGDVPAAAGARAALVEALLAWSLDQVERPSGASLPSGSTG